MWGSKVGGKGDGGGCGCVWGGYLLLCAISQVKCKDMFESAPAKIFCQDKLAAVARLPIIINNKAFYLKPGHSR